jgi:3-oxo-5-alpha-steroid 4-dehydrogenase 1
MGKTSVVSRLNIPGRIAWITMECPGFLTLLYIMRTLPGMYGITDLPWQNKVLAGLFVRLPFPCPPPFSVSTFAPIFPARFFFSLLRGLLANERTQNQVLHYTYRAVLFPFLQPSMSPIHVSVWALAITFQVCNATSIGSWLAAYGPTTASAWDATGPFATARFVLGISIFYFGLAGNFFHDEELREIRRRKAKAVREAKKENASAANRDANTSVEKKDEEGVQKHYALPEAGFFRFMLYPHYLCEWVEWTGFWMAAGWGCVPARAFVMNEVVTMAPRAVRGKWWYIERFGEEKVGKKWAILPGVY